MCTRLRPLQRSSMPEGKRGGNVTEWIQVDSSLQVTFLRPTDSQSCRDYPRYMKKHQLESELHAKLHFVRSFEPRTQSFPDMRSFLQARRR
jgi:hypothetical protein